MASPAVVDLLERHSHRMPIRAEQIRAIAHALRALRVALGDARARASPQYVALLRLLRAHARPFANSDESFAQVQAVRLQMLAARLLDEGNPFPPQLAAAISQGLVAGFDPVTGAQLPPQSPQQSHQPYPGAQPPAPQFAVPEQPVAPTIPWADRRLPVHRPDINQVDAVPMDPDFLLAERERALTYRMAITRKEVSHLLAAHENAILAQAAASADPARSFDGIKVKVELADAKQSRNSPQPHAEGVEPGLGSSNQGERNFDREQLALAKIDARLDSRTAALLEARGRHVALVALQRAMRCRVLEENARAEREGRRGTKPRQRALKQLQKEHEKLDRARIRREEAEEREQRKRKQQWMNAFMEHTDRFRRYHRDVVRRGVRAVLKSLVKYHDEMSRNATRAERDAERARIQKLKDDDEEGYLELVRKTKNSRLLELLNQTETFLKELGAVVKEERAKTGEVEYEQAGVTNSSAPAKHVYYSIAHAIKEEVTEQSSLMVGGTLKEYQLQGIQWMVSLYNNRLNGILADEMGLGKTIQTLGLITYLMETKENAGPYLIIVPLSTMSNWEVEFARWAPAVRVVVFRGDSKTRRHIYETIIEKNKFNVCLVTYEYVVRGKNWLKRVHWQHIIIDEGHRIKNHESRLSLVLHNHYRSRSRLLLTGTPLQNSLTELWALLNFLLPNVFKSAESFESWFAAPFAQMGVGNITATEDQAQLTEEESLLIIRRLHQVLRPFLLRRLKSDVLRMGEQLPAKKEHVLFCEMSAWQRSMYIKIVKSERIMFTDDNGRQRYDRLLNPVMQLRKCVSHPYLFYPDHSSMVVDSPDLWRSAGKFDMLDSCIQKFLRSGHRVLVFNQMRKVVDLQARMLRYRKIPFYRLDGTTSPDDRRSMVSGFNSDDSDVHVFLLTTRAGGLGVNLQTADTVIIFDSDWNPQMDQQAQDRAHRIGQQREVLILRMITAKSVEEDVNERASFKRGLEQKIIRAGMFDQSSKDSDRQALLRELLRVEEAASDAEDGEDVPGDGMPTDEDINRLLARSEEEFSLFTQIDQDRAAERNFKPKLFTETEIPEFAVKVPKELRSKSRSGRGSGGASSPVMEDLDAKPRRRAASQNVSYGLDSLSELQYIKLMEKAGEGEFASISDGVRSVQGRRRGRPPKPRREADAPSKRDTSGGKTKSRATPASVDDDSVDADPDADDETGGVTGDDVEEDESEDGEVDEVDEDDAVSRTERKSRNSCDSRDRGDHLATSEEDTPSKRLSALQSPETADDTQSCAAVQPQAGTRFGVSRTARRRLVRFEESSESSDGKTDDESPDKVSSASGAQVRLSDGAEALNLDTPGGAPNGLASVTNGVDVLPAKREREDKGSLLTALAKRAKVPRRTESEVRDDRLMGMEEGELLEDEGGIDEVQSEVFGSVKTVTLRPPAVGIPGVSGPIVLSGMPSSVPQCPAPTAHAGAATFDEVSGSVEDEDGEIVESGEIEET